MDVLIQEQGCQALDEQTVHDHEQLFKDMDFGPEAKYNPIYFTGDID